MHDSKKGVLIFLALAFGIAWALWVPLLFGLHVSTTHPLFQLAILPGGFAPAVAAIIVRKWVTREGFRDAGLVLNLTHWRIYVFALLWPLAASFLIAGLVVGLGIERPDWSVTHAIRALAAGRGSGAALPRWLPYVLPVQLVFNAVIVAPLLWGEEFGWRGYLQQRLYPGQPVRAAVVTGLIWGVWHYPLILAGYEYPQNRLLGLLLFPVSTVLLAIILGWILERSGSIWATSVGHAAINTVGGSLSVLWFMDSPRWVLVSFVGVLGWVPLGILAAGIVVSGQLNKAAAAIPKRAGVS
ncbi:MAG: CPBP family intramembrane metalloprotease [Herpetosiphon sp.]